MHDEHTLARYTLQLPPRLAPLISPRSGADRGGLPSMSSLPSEGDHTHTRTATQRHVPRVSPQRDRFLGHAIYGTLIRLE